VQILSAPHAGASFTYHVFTSSGTLTVTSGGSLALCTVGGGGGSGFNIPGGGGGGELDLFANFTVSANLTITIGAGGAFSTSGAVKGSNGGTSTVVEVLTTHQSALGGGGSGSANGGFQDGVTGGSGGGANYQSITGGGASGSNTFAGGAGFSSGAESHGGGGGGATAVGLSNPNPTGGQGYALTSIDANLTSTNFPTTLTSKTHVSSGGGGGYYVAADTNGPQAGGTNAGAGEYDSSIRNIAATSPTSYGCGGGGGGGFTASTGTAGFDGVVIVRYLTGAVSASGGQETVTGLPI
jgi:hypothetical protein